MRRRDFLAGALVASALPGRARAEPPRFERDIVVDIHCHSFNASDLPITGFLAHYVPGLSELTHAVTPVPEQILRKVVGTIHRWLNLATPSADDELPALRAALGRPEVVAPVPPLALSDGPVGSLAEQLAALFRLDARRVRAALTDTAQTLYLVSHARARVAASLACTYPTVGLFTPLLVDYDAWSDDHPASPLASQIAAHQLVAKLSIRGRVGRADARLHPFVAFDPLREVQRQRAAAAADPARPVARSTAAATAGPGAMELLRRAIEQAGFIGVKVYPTVGFLPIGNAERLTDRALGGGLDQALRGLYAYCQAEEVPITAHTSPANAYALGLHELAAPDRWAPVLSEFPRLRLNFGHFGHEQGADGGRGVETREAWMRQAAALIDAYPNVYADLSNSPLVYDAAYAVRFAEHLKSLTGRYQRLPSRLMYGSDWWLNRFSPGADDFVTEFQRKLEAWFGPAARRDIMGRNALRFLGFLDDDSRPLPGNKNRRRLRAFYAGEPLPDWLA
jgi:predicted TIM-barrel fold metal-dependent hydrolase